MSSALIFSKRTLLGVALLLLPQLHAEQENFNGLANPSTRSANASNHWTVSADFLAWFASEEIASIWADVISVGDNTSTWYSPSFDFNWDFGFRIGVGKELAYDQWDTSLNWTWYRTDATHTIPSQPDTRIGPEFFAAFLSGNVPNSMKGKWSLLFNMFDWELGRSYRITKSLSLRPFLGLKGGWINQSVDINYYDLTINNIPTQNSGKEHLKNNFWGIGPLGGVNTQWTMRHLGNHRLNLFGDFSMATMWGTWICSDRYKNTASYKTSVNTKNSTLGALMFQGILGVGWDVDIHAGKSHFAAKLGYEMQLWLDQLRLATFQLQRLHHDLTLQGITLNCQFDF